MKKIYFIVILLTISSCSNNSEKESFTDSELKEISKEESKQKLIESCKIIDGIVDADVIGDILQIKANITEIEGQKLSDEMLNEIKKYDIDIKSVVILNLNEELMGYSGAEISD